MAACGMDRRRVYDFLPEDVAAAAAAAQGPAIRGGVALEIPFSDRPSRPVGAASASRVLSPSAARQRAASLSAAVEEWRSGNSGSDAASSLTAHPRAPGAVSVSVRIRPCSDTERSAEGTADNRGHPTYSCVSTVSPDVVAMHNEVPALGGAPTAQLQTLCTRVHHAFPGECGDHEIYASLGPKIRHASQSGHAVHVIAYGPTGTGKTHTASALARSIGTALLEEVPAGMPCRIAMVLFENLGERCFDLLGDLRELNVLEDSARKMQVQGLTQVVASSAAELLEFLDQGFAARRSGPTEANLRSSRSHAICELRILSNDAAQDTLNAVGLIRIVDLAGSERSRDTMHHSVERMQEAKDVNWSLACLRDCIRCMSQAGRGKSSRPSFRRSKLTLLLRECFEAGAHCIWIAHLAPTSANIQATRSTIKCAEELLLLDAKGQPKSAATPEAWTKAQVAAWLRGLEDGRFSHLIDAFAWANGRELQSAWLPDLIARCAIAGASEEDANAIYDAFHAMLRSGRGAVNSSPVTSCPVNPNSAPCES